MGRAAIHGTWSIRPEDHRAARRRPWRRASYPLRMQRMGAAHPVPFSACGVFGLKPTRARTPLGPLRGENWSGLGRAHAVSITVRDSATLLDATAGPAPGDPYYAPPPERPYVEEVTRDPGKLRVSFTDRRPDSSTCDPEIAVAVREAAQFLEKSGHIAGGACS